MNFIFYRNSPVALWKPASITPHKRHPFPYSLISMDQCFSLLPIWSVVFPWWWILFRNSAVGAEGKQEWEGQGMSDEKQHLWRWTRGRPQYSCNRRTGRYGSQRVIVFEKRDQTKCCHLYQDVHLFLESTTVGRPRCQIPLLQGPRKKVFPGGSDNKESACHAGDPGSIPGSGKSPREVNGYPFQYYCLEKSRDRGAWRATVHRVAKS